MAPRQQRLGDDGASFAVDKAASSPKARRFPASVTLGVLAVSLSVFIAPTLLTLHRRWTDFSDPTYTHGYLILLLTGFLAWKAYRTTPFIRVSPAVTAVLAVAVLVAVMVVGRASDTELLAQFALPLLIFCALAAVLGWEGAKPFVWVPLYLYFAVPLWEGATGALRDLTVYVVSAWVRVVDLPAFIEGNNIQLPSGAFAVEDGCSGLHYVIVALSLAAFQGLAFYRRWQSRSTLLLAAFCVALVANWIRVFALVVVGHATEMQHYLVTVDHTRFGWAVFFACYVPVFWLGRVIERREAVEHPGGAPRAVSVGGRPWPAIVAAAILLLGGFANQRVAADAVRPVGPSSIALPALDGWRKGEAWAGASAPSFAGAVSASSRYRGDAGEVAVFFAHYPLQEQGREVVYYANRVHGADDVVAARTSFSLADGEQLPVSELEVVSPSGQRRVLWSITWVAGRPVANAALAKWFQAVGAFDGRRDAQVLVLSADCGQGCDTARAALLQYAANAGYLHGCAGTTLAVASRTVGRPTRECIE